MASLSACAVNVPHMGNIGTAPQQRVLNEIALLGHIQCELHAAYEQVKDEADFGQELNVQSNTPPNNSIAWLDGWGVKVNLEFQVEAKSDFQPTLGLTDTLQNAVKTFPVNGDVPISRSRGAALSAGYTRDITRTETIGYFFPFSNFKDKRLLPPRVKGQQPPKFDASVCGQKTHIVSDDDLQIYDFLRSKMELAATPGILGQSPPAQADPAKPEAAAKIDSPFSTLSYDVHFVVTTAAGATPKWTLVGVTINGDGNFYQGTRVKSDHLTMTFGAPESPGATKASTEVDQQHFARLIGQYVGDAVNKPRSR